ncbi:hypothetical protein [Streptosporangium sp. NPDC002524]|uniref:hypothetical protein n=1 Tax=Streptosporangium sp. NPDC002524 TaxID=3154537 RepID=UPI00331BFE8F
MDISGCRAAEKARGGRAIRQFAEITRIIRLDVFDLEQAWKIFRGKARLVLPAGVQQGGRIDQDRAPHVSGHPPQDRGGGDVEYIEGALLPGEPLLKTA